MSRLKKLGTWIILVLAFIIFSNGLIYLMIHGEEIGMRIYNATHKEESVNVVGKSESK